MKREDIFLLMICLGLTAFSIMQGSVFGAALPSIVKDLGINWSLMGIVMSMLVLVSAISPFLIGKYIYGLKTIHSITIVIFLLSLTTIFIFFVKDFISLISVRLIASFMIPFSYPLVVRLVTAQISVERRGIATAFYNTGSIIGLALGYIIVALVNGIWRNAMIVAGLIGISYIPIIHFFWNRLLNSRVDTIESSAFKVQTNPIISSRVVYKIAIWLSLGHFSAVYTWNLMFNWLSTFLVRELQLTYGAIAFSLGIMAVISVILEISGGIWLDRVGGIKRRILLLYIGLLPSALLLMISAFSSSSIMAIVFMSLSILFWRLSTPSFWTIFSDLIPPIYFERASSIYMMGVLLSGVFSSTINGYIVSITNSMRYAVLLSSVILIFSPIFYTIAGRLGDKVGISGSRM